MTFTLTSEAFSNGDTIPTRYTADGPDRSPPLSWTNAPKKTESFALICDDPDAPRGTWVHWVLYNISKDFSDLPEGIITVEILPDNSFQGVNDFQRVGYGGPCPPQGPDHRYYFKLYALDTVLDLEPKATKAEVENAMQGHILAECQLMGTYGRPE